ncbi:ATP-binding protein [Aestuariivirga sp.]|uniref:ATP-binding protein n=1 Tax=Aestuariivirga sp. TaxID=2650926 RepID=UPI0039E65417
MSDPFAPIHTADDPPRSKAKQDTWEVISPVPDEAPAPPAEHYSRGKPSRSWQYLDATGKLLGFVWRFDTEEGEKEFLPLTYCRKADGSGASWRFKSWTAPRPLYGLRKLAVSPFPAVLVCEGEKAADAAQRLLPDLVTVTSPGGSKAATKADWSSLAGRDVAIWPDNDAAGKDYAEQVARFARKAKAISVVVITPPAGVAQGWDAADAEAEGFSPDHLKALIDGAKVLNRESSDAADEKPEDDEPKRRRPRQSTETIDLLDSLDVEFWIDQDGEAFASVPVNGHFENRSLRSKEFKRWLAGQQYRATGGAISSQVLEDSLRVLEARASIDGQQYDTWRRVGEHSGKIYIDLGDASWRAVEVTSLGWKVISNPPCKFIRGSAIRALPEPLMGGSVDALRGFFNFESDDEFQLLVMWTVQALRSKGPYPVLCINGEQGSGKSILTQVLRSLTDPNGAPLRAAPGDDRDLFVMANNAWVLALDNLSSISEWLSDALCRVSTGGGFSTRTLHSDKDETFFYLQRPIILNGIPSLTNRPDLADRSVSLFLKAMPAGRRRAEEEFWKDFDKAAPEILGALLDGVSAGLRNVDKVKIAEVPRMADFTKWMLATEPGLGFKEGSTFAAYQENRREISETTYEADPVAVAIANLAKHKGSLDCGVSELLTMLNDASPEALRKSRSWPASPTGLGSKIRRVAQVLRDQGFLIDFGHSGKRFVRIIAPAELELQAGR